jgi:iron complex transport system substrate-binding protein
MKYRTLPLLTLLALLMLISITPLAAQEGDTFPVTIEHQFGTTTINEPPQRIVSIGYTEQDYLLALGVTPIAVRYWYGDENDAIFPWADEYVTGEEPVILNMGYGTLNYEAILALQPDLISAVTSGITADEYALLSEIAPTIAQSDEYINFGMPWQEVTKTIGAALGKSAEAETIVADVEALFADARAEHPEFEGKTVAVTYSNGGTYGFYTDQDTRGRFFTELGFVVPQEMIDLAGELFYADVSVERTDLLDQDLIAILNLQFIEGGREALEAEPLFSQLTAVQEGRVLYLEEQTENAIGFSSPLSLAYALNAVIPQLEAIFGEGEATPEATSEGEATPESTETASTSCEAGFQLIVHALGETCVSEAAERVVTLEHSMTEAVVTLGVQPVGVAEIDRYNVLVNLPIPLSEDAVDVGTRNEPNLEVITSLNPDLIIAASWRVAETYDELNAIAPTIAFEGSDSLEAMAGYFTTIATALDRVDVAEQVLADMNQHFADAAASVAAANASPEFVLSQTWYEDSLATFRLFTDNAMPVEILTQMGLENAWDGEPTPDGFTTVGIEALGEIGETNFLYITDPDSAPFYAESPLWNSLPFVQAGTSYRLSDSLWLFGGPLSAQRFVDEVLAAFGIEAIATPEVTPES